MKCMCGCITVSVASVDARDQNDLVHGAWREDGGADKDGSCCSQSGRGDVRRISTQDAAIPRARWLVRAVSTSSRALL